MIRHSADPQFGVELAKAVTVCVASENRHANGLRWAELEYWVELDMQGLLWAPEFQCLGLAVREQAVLVAPRERSFLQGVVHPADVLVLAAEKIADSENFARLE